MRKALKLIIPAPVVLFFKKIRRQRNVFWLFWYDFVRFNRYSAAVSGDYRTRSTLIAAITMDYHRIEKGLTMRKPREKFGLWFIPTLIDNILLYKTSYGNHPMLTAGYSAVSNYVGFHQNRAVALPELESKYAKLRDAFEGESKIRESVKVVDLGNLKAIVANSNFKAFALARHSVRSFDPTIVEENKISEAIEIASKSPSVCNRQAWHVYSVTGEMLEKLLPLQNGNLGFRDDIKNLAIITGKTSHMRHATERNQIYIDGGLFSMSLMYAFLSMEIGTCPLNWCVLPQTDRKLRSLINIPNDEEVIMYMAFGYIIDQSLVAASPRNPVSDTVTFIS